MIHELKTWPLQWDAVNQNTKRVELRKADRHFSAGDILVLKEWNPKTEEYTGRECQRRVTHILRGENLFGLSEGFVAMSLAVIEGPPIADPITFSDTCCGKCTFGTCYVDQMTGA